ncbi:peptidoglycan D,D-transpeptidase FtsI family protein [Desertimonas flava]|uniref:peptidoglycan D,D-transpeptidase FtsI family protein n=1 Tax=Desertimonas flava TaxID=2064846 RepID=UPI0013C41796|nr:penicillin-binding transpeptidase domain-containing protein [Desertimonas flava]
MNRKIRQLAFGLMGCFVLLFVALNYWQVGRESDLNADAGNTRAIRREFGRPRGDIITRDGRVVAQSVPTPDGSDFPFQRVYPTDELFANVTGYYTLAYGATQLEFTQNDVLTGDTARQRIGNLDDIVSGGDGTGSVRLTLDYDLQLRAQQLLEAGNYVGSITVVDTQTGAVLAMYSNPTFNPNVVASFDTNVAGEYLAELNDAPDNPLLANAYQDRFAPGSTFKVLTTSIALDDGVVDTNTTFPVESEWEPPQTNNPIQNYNGNSCGGTLVEVFTRSCNIPFARIAVEHLGINRFINGVTRWGVGQAIPIDLPRPAASSFGPVDDLDQNLPLLAMRGFGAESVQMVPLHTTMITAAIANGGVMFQPYVVGATLDSDGDVLEVNSGGDVWLTAISPQTAATMTDLMVSVAERGTASCCIALDNGISVAAKTGTAGLPRVDGEQRSNIWITAFAPVDQPRYAVTVTILGRDGTVSEQTGGGLAGPIAKEMLDAAFQDETT